MFLANLRNSRRRTVAAVLIVAALFPVTSHAVPGHIEDSIADVLVWVVLILVPILAVWLFWKLHVLPEVIAEKRHHPQSDAIKALCLLSLAFGGMLWPFAWLWAYTKPIGYRLAYGRDKHDDYYEEINARQAETASVGEAELVGPPPRQATRRDPDGLG